MTDIAHLAFKRLLAAGAGFAFVYRHFRGQMIDDR
jgi:hypothetical protein